MASSPSEPLAFSSEDAKPRPSSNLVPSCGLLVVSSAKLEPFLRPLKNPPNILAIGAHIQSSALSSADKCLRFLHSVASRNPLLAGALSFHREFVSLCHYHRHQIRCRNKANPTPGLGFAAVLPGDSVAGLVVANGVMNFLNLYNTVLVVRLVLTWFPNAPQAIVSPLSTICDPYLNVFRGLIPPLGGLDLSPILAFLVLNAFTSTAAALPAELPAGSGPPAAAFTDVTASQEKWARRIEGTRRRAKSSREENS